MTIVAASVQTVVECHPLPTYFLTWDSQLRHDSADGCIMDLKFVLPVKYNNYSYILNGELSTGQCVGTTPVYVNSMPSQVYIKYGDLINLVMALMILA